MSTSPTDDHHAKSKEHIDELAEALAINYFHVSVGNINPDDGMDEIAGKISDEAMVKRKTEHEKAIEDTIKKADRIFAKDFREKLLSPDENPKSIIEIPVSQEQIANQENDPDKSNKPLKPKHHLGFSRNILVVGAGASKDLNHEIPIASEAVVNIENNMRLYFDLFEKDMAKESHRRECEELRKMPIYELKDRYKDTKFGLYILFAQEVIHVPIDESQAFENLQYTLGFEGRLKVLVDIHKPDNVQAFIADLLGYKYYPSLFYEIVAHLFKHRFIDIIINLNFDELLDNAIEDEMGDSDYHHITKKSDCPDFDSILSERKLKVPVYIKPHGTFSDPDSLKYTTRQYLSMHEKMKELLEKIFDGHCKEKDLTGNPRHVRQFNFILAGYAFNDIDLHPYFLKNIKRAIKGEIKTKIYVFDLRPDEVANEIGNRLYPAESYVSRNEQESKELAGKQIEDHNKRDRFKQDHIRLFGTTRTKGLGQWFEDIFEQIRPKFQKPFQPSGILRHQYIASLFGDGTVGGDSQHLKISKFTNDLKADLLFKKCMAYLIFDLIKFNGLLPKNILTHDRAGKYFSEYKEFLMKHTGLTEQKIIHPVQALKEIMASGETQTLGTTPFDLNEPSKITSDLHNISYEDFYKVCFPQTIADIQNWQEKAKNRDEMIREMSRILVQEYSLLTDISGKDLLEQRRNLRAELFETLRRICYQSAYEINAIYDDRKHNIFNSFRKENVINTNLCLTWTFQDFMMNHDDWNEFCLISRSGTSILNLGPGNLRQLKGKDIKLLHAIPQPYGFDDKKNHDQPFDIFERIQIQLDPSTTFDHRPCDEHDIFHQMALFVKRKKPDGEKEMDASGKTPIQGKQVDKAVRAIYFFKPVNKIRINPVIFDIRDDEPDGRRHNESNLQALMMHFDNIWRKKQIRE